MQRSTLLVKINNLLMKKHIYAAHLAIIEGRPPPLPPTMNSLAEFEQDAFSATSGAVPIHIKAASALGSDANEDYGKLPTNYDTSAVEAESEKEKEKKSNHVSQQSFRRAPSVKRNPSQRLGTSMGSDHVIATPLKSASSAVSESVLPGGDGSLGINFDKLQSIGDDVDEE